MENYDIATMGNWHHDIAIADGIRTSHLSSPYDMHAFTNKESIAKEISRIYGTQLKDKNILDIACNAGGHLFELNRFGIKAGFGFDVRPLWINQAHWVQRNIDIPCDNLKFVVGNFEVLKGFASHHFHLSLFNGIFYHLANPIAELEKVAEKTSELIIVNTAYAPSHDDNTPALICKQESSKMVHGLSGVEGLSWLPNGEVVLYEILKHLGFPYYKLMFKNMDKKRLAVIAARNKGLL
jgi:tRNA (mo5U34)-methyltransferase